MTVSDTLAQLVVPLVHAFATMVMAGLILVIQFVHYPLLVKVPPAAFHEYERSHMRRITPIVGPAMAIESLSAIWLAVDPPGGVAGRGLTWVLYVGLGLVAVNIVSTATVQGPAHGRLARDGHDPERIAFLVRTNLIRTAAWVVRGVLALVVLALAASPVDA